MLLDKLFTSRVSLFYLASIAASCDILFFRYAPAATATAFTALFYDPMLLATIICGLYTQQKLSITIASLFIAS